MKIGVISDSDLLIPLAYALATQGLQVYVFYSPRNDDFVNNTVSAFFAQAKSIDSVVEQKAEIDLYQWLQSRQLDICFVIGFGRKIRLDKLEGIQTALLNIHFGKLPSYRGPIPVFWQLKNGEKTLGLTIHKLTDKFDAGPIVWSKEIENKPHLTYRSVSQAFSHLCIEGALSLIDMLLKNKELADLETTNSDKNYQKRPNLQDVSINWKDMSSKEICDLARACNPWNKGAITIFKQQEVKIVDAHIVHDTTNKATVLPGTILDSDKQLLIACSDQKTIAVNMLFYNENFLPTYHSKYWGFVKGEKFSNLN